MSPFPNGVPTDDSQPSQPQVPNDAIPRRPPFRSPFPPTPPFRPLSFWQIFFKDVATTCVGVSVLCGFLFFGFLLAVGLVAYSLKGEGGSDLIDETVISGSDDAESKIVVLPLEGIIETDETGFFAEAIQTISDDSKVSGVVLRVNSPGGTIAGSDYDLHLLKKLKEERNIPIVVSMGDLATSGGYYVSTVGDKIFAERSTTTGSIGVIVSMYNASELCKKLGVRSNAITSGPLKGMGDFMKEPSPEETAVWQKTVDEAYEQFLSVIREGRPWYSGQADAEDETSSKRVKIAGVNVATEIEETTETTIEKPAENENDAENDASNEIESTAQAEVVETPQIAQDSVTWDDDSSTVLLERDKRLRKIADGRIYSAAEAKELRLIDEIGFIDDAIDEAIKLAGLNKDGVQVVRYSETVGLLDSLTCVKSDVAPLGKALQTLSAPRCYYMLPRATPISVK